MKKDSSVTTKKSARKGVVVSAKMDKTIVVAVDTVKSHEKYRKQYRSTKHYKVDDPDNVHKTGDVVEFVECRPLSVGKKYQLKKN